MVHLEADGVQLKKNQHALWETMPDSVPDGRRSNPRIYQEVGDAVINAKTKIKLVQGHGRPRVAVRKEIDIFDQRMFDPNVILKPEYNRVVRLKDIV
jgi:hypothetical protein